MLVSHHQEYRMLRRKFPLAVESLESRSLLSSDFAYFTKPILGADPTLDGRDSTAQTIYTVPNQLLDLTVTTPDGYNKLQRVTFNLPNTILIGDGEDATPPISSPTLNAPHVNNYQVTKTWTDANGQPSVGDQVMYEFREGLDPGTYQVKVTVVARRWGIDQSGNLDYVYDTLVDTLTVINEIPTVRTFQVNVPSMGFDYQGADGDTSQNPTGTAWLHLNNGPDDNHGGLSRGFATYTTTITNTTHYAIDVGILQTVEGAWTLLYDNGATDPDSYGRGVTTTLDTRQLYPRNPFLRDAINNDYYQDKSLSLPIGSTKTLGTDADPIQDSPSFSAPLADHGGHLLQMSLEANYQTSLLLRDIIYSGDGIQPTKPVKILTPSLFSTVNWHLYGLGEMGWDPTNYGDGPQAWNIYADDGEGYAVDYHPNYNNSSFTATPFPGPNQAWLSWADNIQDAVATSGLNITAAIPSTPTTPVDRGFWVVLDQAIDSPPHRRKEKYQHPAIS
jgi:hypothetical protein